MIEETYISSLTLDEGFNEAWVHVLKDPRAGYSQLQSTKHSFWNVKSLSFQSCKISPFKKQNCIFDFTLWKRYGRLTQKEREREKDTFENKTAHGVTSKRPGPLSYHTCLSKQPKPLSSYSLLVTICHTNMRGRSCFFNQIEPATIFLQHQNEMFHLI